MYVRHFIAQNIAGAFVTCRNLDGGWSLVAMSNAVHDWPVVGPHRCEPIGTKRFSMVRIDHKEVMNWVDCIQESDREMNNFSRDDIQ